MKGAKQSSLCERDGYGEQLRDPRKTVCLRDRSHVKKLVWIWGAVYVGKKGVGAQAVREMGHRQHPSSVVRAV